MAYGMLIDLSKCMGCRGCQVACKQWNDLPGEETSLGTDYTNPQKRSAYTWTTIEFITAEVNGKTVSTFTKTGCLHCLEPACESVCIAGAIKKNPNGAVTIDHDKCIGCRYCQIGCPFGVPKYEYDQVVPRMRKCDFCFDRIEAGLEPACAATCPADAIIFGERDDLLKLARERIARGGGRYVDHIYGEHEAGGTSVLYISSVPLDLTALNTDVTTDPVPSFTWKAMRQLPALVSGVAVLSLGLMAYSKRRALIEAEQRGGVAQ
ncbi:MAG: 4Fe-4S dicluster domain-containing protein [Symbiobacterium sp.]|uniref:4Fe-4S dicluster domain-containing protein n=1 Tax=Symbiobacterium sp. TaxID=1971213 RepID=UPI00346423CB